MCDEWWPICEVSHHDNASVKPHYQSDSLVLSRELGNELLVGTINPFPLILNHPSPPILNPPNIVPICNKGEVLLYGGGGV